MLNHDLVTLPALQVTALPQPIFSNFYTIIVGACDDERSWVK